MRAKLTLALFVVAVFAAVWLARAFFWVEKAEERNGGQPPAAENEPPRRIVSLAPALTETLFTLGLGKRVVGVTRYCDYPPEVEPLPHVGGLIDPNYEAVVALEPDLVLLYEEHVQQGNRLAELNIPTLVLKHDTLADILASLRKIGRTCGKTERADRLVEKMQRELDTIRARTQDLKRPRVLISLDRDLGAGTIKNAFVAGPHGFYNELLDVAGGRNAYTGAAIQFPKLSAEGILEIDPDVIFDLAGAVRGSNLTREEVLADWNALPNVTAVKDSRVYLFTDNHLMRPGPRVVELTAEFARRLHPKVDWSAE